MDRRHHLQGGWSCPGVISLQPFGCFLRNGGEGCFSYRELPSHEAAVRGGERRVVFSVDFGLCPLWVSAVDCRRNICTSRGGLWSLTSSSGTVGFSSYHWLLVEGFLGSRDDDELNTVSVSKWAWPKCQVTVFSYFTYLLKYKCV